MQSRLDLHRHELLKQQFASVGDLDLADVLCRVLAASAVVLELKQVSLAEETASVAHMHAVAVRHVEKTFFQEAGRAMRDHAVALHLSEAETTITGSSLSRLSSQDLCRSSTS